MEINQAAAAVEAFVRTFEASGAKAVEVQVRPSGDEVDVIKVWVDLGGTKADPAAWAKACEAAVKQGVPKAASFTLAVRAEAGA